MEDLAIPIHRSLTEPILLGGVPRELAILNGTFCAAIVLGLHSLWGLPLGALIHAGSVALAKKDKEFFSVFRRHLIFKTYYEA